VPDWVACADCGTAYDAAQITFCPRCGATAVRPRTPSAANPAGTSRRDPARMRLQLGGIVLLVIGLLATANSGYLLLAPGLAQETVYKVAAAQTNVTGGTVALHLTDAGRAVAGARVWAVGEDGRTLLNGTTDADGRLSATLKGAPAGQLHVAAGNLTWTRRVVAFQGSTLDVALDTRDPVDSPEALGVSQYVTTVLVASTGLSLLLALGGLAAVLVRWRGLALGGPLPMVALAVLFALLFLSVGGLVLLLLLGGPYALILSGRAAFRRRLP